MKLTLNVLTIVGGHLLVGQRTRGYLLLGALIMAPLLSWIAQAIWLAIAPNGVKQAPYVASGVLLVALIAIWFTSISLSLRNRTLRTPDQSPRPGAVPLFEAVIGSVLSIAIVVFALFVIGMVPFVAPERQMESTGIHRLIQGRPMPAGDGSVRFVGTLLSREGSAGTRRMVFQFDKGFVSKEVITDSNGKFALRLPPGEWTLLAPHVEGVSGNIDFRIEPPVPGRQLRFVVSGGEVRETYTFEIRIE